MASLAKQFTVLLLGHTLAALLNNGTHRISSLYSYPAEPFDSVATRGDIYTGITDPKRILGTEIPLRFRALPT